MKPRRIGLGLLVAVHAAGCAQILGFDKDYHAAGDARGCGDGAVADTEECDDGDNAPEDGCSEACVVETGFRCEGEPSVCAAVCGDGIVVGGLEQCDPPDGVTCNASCQPYVEDCSNHEDDDHDGLIDCEDPSPCKDLGYCDPGPTPTGGPCESPTDCQANQTDPFCWRSEDGFPQGYCSEFCDVNADDCGADALCLSLPLPSGAGLCMDRCTTKDDCRPGYTCNGLVAYSPICFPIESGCGDGVVGGGEACDDGNLLDGDGCSSGCFEEAVTSTVSGDMNCTTDVPYAGRKAAFADQLTLYAAMRCGDAADAVFVAASHDGGVTFNPPMDTGIKDVVEVAVAAVPGVAYVAATTLDGKLLFTRSTDVGKTWAAPVELDADIASHSGASIAVNGSSVFIAVSQGSTMRVHRNTKKGEGVFTVTPITGEYAAYMDVLVDPATSDVYVAFDNPTMFITRSTDGGVTFDPWVSPPGPAYYSDWVLGNGTIYSISTTDSDPPDNQVWVIPTWNLATSSPAMGLPSAWNWERAIAAGSSGNAYIVTSPAEGSIQLHVLPFGSLSFVTYGNVAPAGTAPAIAVRPDEHAVAVVYTSGTEVKVTRFPF